MKPNVVPVSENMAKVIIKTPQGGEVTTYYQRKEQHLFRLDPQGTLTQMCEGFRTQGKPIIVNRGYSLAPQLIHLFK